MTDILQSTWAGIKSIFELIFGIAFGLVMMAIGFLMWAFYIATSVVVLALFISVIVMIVKAVTQ